MKEKETRNENLKLFVWNLDYQRHLDYVFLKLLKFLVCLVDVGVALFRVIGLVIMFCCHEVAKEKWWWFNLVWSLLCYLAQYNLFRGW